MTESVYQQAVSKIAELSNAQLDHELEEAAVMNETSEMLLCCYLYAASTRRAFEDFGYANICDYAQARFGFGERKTRYLVALGRKLERLPKIREALASGKLGWCKASRVASVASADNEAVWLDSALSMTVQQLESRIKDGTDPIVSTLRLALTNDLRLMWEAVLEIYRRRAGADISSVEAFEYLLAEALAQYGDYQSPSETADATAEPEPAPPEPDVETPTVEPAASEQLEPTLFPWAGEIDEPATSAWEDERAAEADFATSIAYDAVRNFVLERDGWKCTYPGCNARATLHVHHIRFRSQSGSDEPSNLTVVCYFHHKLIHTRRIGLRGVAPLQLEWTPPERMRDVLARGSETAGRGAGELGDPAWSAEGRAAPA